MTGWNLDFTDAPKGTTTRTVRTVSGPNGPIEKVYESFVPTDVWVVGADGSVIKSYWVPSRNQWAGLGSNEKPLAWQLYVKPVWNGMPEDDDEEDGAFEIREAARMRLEAEFGEGGDA